jgi:hypothetical protein
MTGEEKSTRILDVFGAFLTMSGRKLGGKMGIGIYSVLPIVFYLMEG